MQHDEIKVGMRISAPDGWHSNGMPRELRRGTVRDFYGMQQWPMVEFDDTPGKLMTCTPSALSVLDD